MSAINKSIYETLTIESRDGKKTVDVRLGTVSVDYYEDIFSPTITATIVGTYDYAQSGTLRPTIEDRLHIGKEVSGALLSSGNQNGLLTNNLRIRKLTPKECFRLMGFDDIDFDKAVQVNSNTQLYKQAGNSIVVNVLEAIFNNLLDKNKEYELLELFGGIGAPRKALQRQEFNVKVFDYVEWDKYAVKSYNAIYNEEFEPQDVSKWDKEWN
jgi:site-specific DNA-cytosine methylase